MRMERDVPSEFVRHDARAAGQTGRRMLGLLSQGGVVAKAKVSSSGMVGILALGRRSKLDMGRWS